MKKHFVTGGAGFIGSNLCDRLLNNGDEVICYDNLSRGRAEFISNAKLNKKFNFIHGDILDSKLLEISIKDCDIVWHLAANADIKKGILNVSRDLEQNTIGTFNVMKAAVDAKIEKFIFASTSAIYGEHEEYPTPENCSFPVQTSFYSASKLAGESLIQAFTEAFEIKSYIYRFSSILGPRYTHGHVYDFIEKLKKNPHILDILGNGNQIKCYLHVEDLINAMLNIISLEYKYPSIYNLGNGEIITIKDSAKIITDTMNLCPEFRYQESKNGWIGDNPIINLDVSLLMSTGWRPLWGTSEAVVDTVLWLLENQYVFLNE